MDPSEQLKSYIYQQLQAGLGPDEVAGQLRSAGWDEQTIQAAFSGVQAQITPSAAPVAPVADDGIASNKQQPAQFQASGQKRGRIKTGWLLMKQSLKVLGGNKQLVRYSAMSFIVSLLIIAFAIAGLVFGGDVLFQSTIGAYGADESSLSVAGYIYILAFYILSTFVVFIYMAGLTAHTLDIFQGRDQGYKHYMSVAWAKKAPIFVYTLITVTVGLILGMIEERAKWLGWIISRIFGALWKLANLFTIPVILESDSGAPAAIKQSTKLFVSRWGENIAGRVSFAGLMILIYIVVFVVPLCILLLVIGVSPLVFTILLVVLLAMLIPLSIVEYTLSTILSTALYYYAKNGQVPAAFSADLLNSTIVPKRKRRFFGGKKDQQPAAV